jgi:hypothetical protein
MMFLLGGKRASSKLSFERVSLEPAGACWLDHTPVYLLDVPVPVNDTRIRSVLRAIKGLPFEHGRQACLTTDAMIFFFFWEKISCSNKLK